MTWRSNSSNLSPMRVKERNRALLYLPLKLDREPPTGQRLKAL
jgi:hypothetical protein